jgi:N-acyl-D-amino-acid deacylase
MYDLLIRNAKVVDGTGNPWFRGDVAISGTSIAAVGRVTGEAARVIEANGLCVCPGFIDVHAHGDFTPYDKTVVDYKLRQGITTEVPRAGGALELAQLRRISRQHRASAISH